MSILNDISKEIVVRQTNNTIRCDFKNGGFIESQSITDILLFEIATILLSIARK
jgi:hypothetical protein